MSRESTAGAATLSIPAHDPRFTEAMLTATLADYERRNDVVQLLERHLGIDPIYAAQASHAWHGPPDVVASQAGLDAFLAQPGRTHEIVGVVCAIGDPLFPISLSILLAPESLTWPGTSFGPPQWIEMACGYERTIRKLARGLVLLRDKEGPAAIWVSFGRMTGNAFTVVAPTPQRAKAILQEIGRLRLEHSPFRGEMILPRPDIRLDGPPLTFLPRPQGVTRDQLVLPPGLLDRIDHHALAISRGAERLAAGRQHLKRGLLLWGPPGTGKTHTIRYLISQLPAETSILWLRGRPRSALENLPYLGKSVVVIFDDVDAIAMDRALPGARWALFDLLDIMDGLHAHGDVLFVLTTNRLEALEPAVAARPGRVDEALKVPLPDADCRRRLFEVYRRGMDLTMGEDAIEELVARTDGVTAAFTKELLRRATVVAIENGATVGPSGLAPVDASDVFAALDEMLDPESPLTRVLLGAAPEHESHRVSVVEEAR